MENPGMHCSVHSEPYMFPELHDILPKSVAFISWQRTTGRRKEVLDYNLITMFFFVNVNDDNNNFLVSSISLD